MVVYLFSTIIYFNCLLEVHFYLCKLYFDADSKSEICFCRLDLVFELANFEVLISFT